MCNDCSAENQDIEHKFTGTIYKANGEMIGSKPKNGKQYGLKELQEIVGGYIEILPLNNGRVLVCNDFASELPVNEKVSKIYGDEIVGDCLICDSSEIA